MLSEQEKQIVQFGKQEGKSDQDILGALSKYRTRQTQGASIQPTDKSTFQANKDRLIGVGKAALGTAIGTAHLAVKGGRYIQAAIDPTRTVEDLNREATNRANDPSVPAWVAPLDGQNKEFIDNILESKNKEQTQGKVAETIAEIFFPVGQIAKGLGLTEKAVKATGATFEGLSSKLAGIGDDVMEGGVKVKDKIIDVVGGLDDKTKTALGNTTREKFMEVVERGKQAMTDDKNITPLEAVGNNVVDALKGIRNKMSEIGAQKSSYLKLPEAFKGDGIKIFNEKLQSFLNSRNLIENDKTIIKQIVTEFKKLGSTPTKGQVDKFIDFAQEALYAGEKNLTLPSSNKTVAGLRNLIGNLNNSLKNQLPTEYRSLNDEYARLATLSKELNTKLGKASGNAGALIKRLFSPSDARTKELFKELGKETGTDFFSEARLAKFVMDVLGDARGKSLLEEMPSATNIVRQAIEYGKKKLDIPFRAAKNLIKNQDGAKLPMKGGQNFAGAIGGVKQGEDGNLEIDPVNAMLAMAGIKATSGTQAAFKELIGHKKDALYLLKKAYTELGEKVNKNVIKTAEKELASLIAEYKKRF